MAKLIIYNILLISLLLHLTYAGGRTPTTTPSSCDAIRCQSGYFCAYVNGAPTCLLEQYSSPLPPQLHQDLCSHVVCQKGAHCIENNGIPSCIVDNYTPPPTHHPSHHTCRNYHCKRGSKCAMINGAPQCIKVSPKPTRSPRTCRNIRCGRNENCITLNGRPTCIVVRPEHCTLPCPSGTRCVFSEDGKSQKCIDNTPTPTPTPSKPALCNIVQCQPGFTCKMIDNAVTCVPDFRTTGDENSSEAGVKPTCDQVLCKEGVCIMVNYEPRCVSNVTSCDDIICPYHHDCMLSKFGAVCVSNSKPNLKAKECEHIACPKSMFCIALNGNPTCIYSNSNAATSAHGPCQGIACPDGMKCSNVEGHAACLYKTEEELCRETHCPSEMECIVNNHEAMCQDIVSGGATSTGSVTGLQGKFGCKDKSECKFGEDCVQVDGFTECIVVPKKQQCGDNVCIEPEFCNEIGGTKMCSIISTTDLCRDHPCTDPEVCAVQDGVPRCFYLDRNEINLAGLPGASSSKLCIGVHCNAPATCVQFQGQAMCRFPVVSGKLTEGYVLENVHSSNKAPMVVRAAPTGCELAACDNWNATCIILDGRAFCVRSGEGPFSDPNSPHCPLISCPSDTMCKEHKGVPYCVRVSPCKSFRCPDNHECRVNRDNEPYCTLFPTISKGCQGVTCSKGYDCFESKCYSKCDRSECPSRYSRCLVINGFKKCI